MNVHVFGAGSSPSCSSYALRRTAIDNQEDFPDKIRNILFNNFYVDDMLKSEDDEQETIEMIQGVKSLCKRGGFNLVKFVTNSQTVLNSLPKEDLGSSLKDASLLGGLTDKVLGVSWNLSDDVFKFDLTEAKQKPLTRRGMLSMISSIYDPLGLISPFILKGRLILQTLCKMQHGWDDQIPEDIATD
ncbi:uncharacterized protein [Clytia hemisphaerica]|uniref:uncharacterized protein n=1 Tax=Clytia hemisphaerica TaxID=252671 RepID=UPI0034D4C117